MIRFIFYIILTYIIYFILKFIIKIFRSNTNRTPKPPAEKPDVNKNSIDKSRIVDADFEEIK